METHSFTSAPEQMFGAVTPQGKRRTISTNDHRSVLRHTAMCKNGQTKIVCLEEKIWAPEFLYERAFYPRGKYGRPPFIC